MADAFSSPVVTVGAGLADLFCAVLVHASGECKKPLSVPVAGSALPLACRPLGIHNVIARDAAYPSKAQCKPNKGAADVILFSRPGNRCHWRDR